MEFREKLSTANYVGKKRYAAERDGNSSKFQEDVEKFRKAYGLDSAPKVQKNCGGLENA